ncbi:hypothetical protein J7E71_06605 [Mesobacillus foraminis]|uniref:hypothetical protein n=1 Tax=Mesobacillus foraminis TaxID=279826 RepID=UPI001BE4F460|nr:hypothetical protein [Mesobacillus foraminis]MBT2755630.1 hypothetical protein [Mesobacillus foraminis]
MKVQYLKPEVPVEKAKKNIQTHLQTWLSKCFFYRKKLYSIELVYLPYFVFPYTLESKSLRGEIQGFVGIETYEKQAAILPAGQETFEADSTTLPLLPVGEEIKEKHAYNLVYQEAFKKEKKRSSIKLQVNSPFLLYVPYYVGYLKGKETDIMAADGLSGNLQYDMKDAILKAFLKESQLIKPG